MHGHLLDELENEGYKVKQERDSLHDLTETEARAEARLACKARNICDGLDCTCGDC